MSPNEIMRVVDQADRDEDFRAALHADLEGTLEGAGITMDANERAALRRIDWSRAATDLLNRLSMPRELDWAVLQE